MSDWYPRWVGVPNTSIGVLVRNAAEGVEEIRCQIKDGVDFIKIAMDGDAMNPATGLSAGFNQEETTAMIAEAHRLGRKVITHARGAEAIRYAAKAGAEGEVLGSRGREEKLGVRGCAAAIDSDLASAAGILEP